MSYTDQQLIVLAEYAIVNNLVNPDTVFNELKKMADNPDESVKPNLNKLLLWVCAEHKIPWMDVLSPTKSKELVECRRDFIYLARRAGVCLQAYSNRARQTRQAL